MFLSRLWADWQKYLHCCFSGTVMITIESRWYSAEFHCEQGPGSYKSSQITILEARSFSNLKCCGEFRDGFTKISARLIDSSVGLLAFSPVRDVSSDQPW